MNFDDYENHILQKYRLAVAITLIRNTPENSTPISYLECLKHRLYNEMESYDPDVTICEEDFNFNDDDNIDYVHNDNDEHDRAINENANNETQFIESKMNDSMTILKDFDFNEMINNVNDDNGRGLKNDSVSDVLKILKGVDNREMLETEIACGDSNNLNHTQSTYFESSQSQQEQNVTMEENVGEIQECCNTAKPLQRDSNVVMNDSVNRRKTNVHSKENATFYDSQRTNTFNEYTDNFTHVSQSQFDNIVLPRYLLEKERPKEGIIEVNNAVNKAIENRNINENSKILKQIYRKADSGIVISDKQQINDMNKHKCSTQGYIENVQAKRSRYSDHNRNSNTDTAYFNEIKSKLNTENTNLELNSNNNTELIVPNMSLFGKSDNIDNDSVYNFSKGTDMNYNNDTDVNKRNSLDNFGSQISVESSNNAFKLAHNSQTLSLFSQEFNCESSNDKPEAVVNIIGNCSTKQNTAEESIFEKTTVDEVNEENEELITEELFDKLTDSQAEAVPFKVLEELNRIKTFLTKRDTRITSGYMSDSGYKSDSQSRSSFKSVLPSPNLWFNQSAHCLLTYIKQCPLVVNTEDITNEISRALGSLIDRLHDEEKYPSFLEEYLLTVDNLLKEIYQEESTGDQLLKKDENIYRLFLLNKSTHIIKYTTEKIISILEEVLTRLTEGQLLETAHTDQTENLSYIFHVLETLLKKLIVQKNFASQTSTQNSQEDEGILKKSSLTEIWRSKWNSVKKPEEDAPSSKQCVLARCSGVLNKIVVQAMDGYSLISYFALQCFNLLQN